MCVGRERGLPSYHTWTVMQWAGWAGRLGWVSLLLVPPFPSLFSFTLEENWVRYALLCGAGAMRCLELCTSTVAADLSLRCIRTCTAPALGHFLPLGLLLGETTRTPSKPRHPSSSGAPASDHSPACKRVVLLLLLYGTVRVQAVRSPPRRGTVQRSCTASQSS